MAQKKDLAAERIYNLVGTLHRQGLISRHDALQYNEDIFVLISAEEERRRRLVFSNQEIEVYERTKNVAQSNRT